MYSAIRLVSVFTFSAFGSATPSREPRMLVF